MFMDVVKEYMNLAGVNLEEPKDRIKRRTMTCGGNSLREKPEEKKNKFTKKIGEISIQNNLRSLMVVAKHVPEVQLATI